jgi:hypothetical protein
MTRRIVYGISLWVFVGAAACTIASVALPNWISYTSPTQHDPIRVTYGLHKRCSSITGECKSFPQDEDCYGDDRSFCSMWRTTGFLLNFALMMELACLVAYTTILAGGRGARETGWAVLTGLLSCVGAAQLIAMALVVRLDSCIMEYMAELKLSLDLLVRPRQSLLRRLGSRQVVDPLYGQLVCIGSKRPWSYLRRTLSA